MLRIKGIKVALKILKVTVRIICDDKFCNYIYNFFVHPRRWLENPLRWLACSLIFAYIPIYSRITQSTSDMPFRHLELPRQFRSDASSLNIRALSEIAVLKQRIVARIVSSRVHEYSSNL